MQGKLQNFQIATYHKIADFKQSRPLTRYVTSMLIKHVADHCHCTEHTLMHINDCAPRYNIIAVYPGRTKKWNDRYLSNCIQTFRLPAAFGLGAAVQTAARSSRRHACLANWHPKGSILTS